MERIQLAFSSSEARRIAELAAGADKTIICVAVIDEHGRILAGAPVAELKSIEEELGDEFHQMGLVAAIVLGAGQKVGEHLGGLRYAVYSFVDTKVLAFNLPHKGLILVAALRPDVPATGVYAKLWRMISS